MRKRDFFHTGLDVSRSELASMRRWQGATGGIPTGSEIGANDYYVDGNVASTGDGTLLSPFSTLAEAIAASNTSIGLAANRWWARRNRIFIMGDTLTEDLTQLPTKCDVIGVGSYDANTQPGLYGHHSSALETYGTRFINIWFKAKAHASPIFTLAGANSASGIQFLGCTFDGTLGTMTSAILATAVPRLHVIDCDFTGTFVTSYITFGAGEMGGARIIGNRMLGTAAIGIVTNIAATASWKPLVNDNIIHATGLVIDDNGDILFGSGNQFISDTDPGADSLTAFDVTQANWVDNKYTGTAGTERNADWPFAVQFAS